MKRALLMALSALMLSACVQALAPFPHRAHLVSTHCGGDGEPACPTCATCHEAGEGSSTTITTPKAEVCARCHQDLPPQRYTSSAPDVRGVRRGLNFAHGPHLALDALRGQCIGCHAPVTDDGASGAVFPDMQTCLGSCHNDDFNRGKCTDCHERDGLRTLVPRTMLRHDQSFMRSHGAQASSQGEVCKQCHSQRDCIDCHDSTQSLPLEMRVAEKIDRELVHRADFVSRHAIESRAQPASCLRCHSVSSCEGCHLERGVSANRLGAMNPHPIGWVGPNTASRDFHGHDARRDILQCAACHDQGPATNCIRCHSVGGPGSNPHPRGWISARSPDESMCRYCHVR